MERVLLDNLSDWNGKDVLSLLGPTGSGKSSAALAEVARRYANPRHPLLVSVDAVALFRGLDIGSAKPLGAERQDYDWVGLDLFDPSEEPSVALFVDVVAPRIEAALKAERPVLLVGGSGFYERALVDGQSPGVASDPVFQQSLEGESDATLHARLCARDPAWAGKVHVNDRYRLKRFLDLAERQDLSLSQLFDAPKLRPASLTQHWQCTHTYIQGLGMDDAQLEARLRARIVTMLAAGWVEETQNLLAQGFDPEGTALQSVGYREISETLRGLAPKATLSERILLAHTQLAKKQRTWCRGLRRRSARLT
jgi:tRNA dimethylallyltransferase